MEVALVLALVGVGSMLVMKATGANTSAIFEGTSDSIGRTQAVCKYDITEEDGSKYTPEYSGMGSKVIRSTAPLEKFEEVKVNGETVDPENYTLREGSTIVEFTEEYMATLPMNTFDVEVISNDGKASCQIINPEKINKSNAASFALPANSSGIISVKMDGVAVNSSKYEAITRTIAEEVSLSGTDIDISATASAPVEFKTVSIQLSPEYVASLHLGTHILEITTDAGTEQKTINVVSGTFSTSEEKADSVAKIERGSGAVYYATLSGALADAKAGETVILLKDISNEEEVKVEAGVTLDLNGCDISGATMLYVTGAIKDSMPTAATKGRVNASACLFPDGDRMATDYYLPIYNGTGYQFYHLKVGDRYTDGTSLELQLAREGGAYERDEALAVLKNGFAASRVKAVITVSWEADGITETRTFPYSDGHMSTYASRPSSTAFVAKFTGTEGRNNLQIQAHFITYNEADLQIASINGNIY